MQSCCRVGVKAPKFNADDPELWFAQLEGQFALSNISMDTTKFYYVLSQLEPQHAAEVRDIIVSPPQTGKFEKLRTELIKRLSASQERKIKQLLMHEELGDRKPSQFLRHLKLLAGATVPNDFIRTIWASRLPTNLQTIVASQTSIELEGLAELADRINDIVPATGQVASTSAEPSLPNNASSAVELLSGKVEELSKKLEAMNVELRRRSRSRSRYSQRSYDYHRSRPRSRPNDHPYCFFHYRFGDRAKKCVQPCSYANKKTVNYRGSQ